MQSLKNEISELNEKLIQAGDQVCRFEFHHQNINRKVGRGHNIVKLGLEGALGRVLKLVQNLSRGDCIILGEKVKLSIIRPR